jgi:predicted Fe-Mo cluster-binding NifX family protein
VRIAVARDSLGEENAHFGYAEHFLVLEVGADVEGAEPVLREVRDATGHCTGAGGNRRLLRDSVDAVSDCVAVVALRIGPCARRALDAIGVLAIEHPGPGLEGVEALVAGLERSRFVQARQRAQQKERAR